MLGMQDKNLSILQKHRLEELLKIHILYHTSLTLTLQTIIFHLHSLVPKERQPHYVLFSLLAGRKTKGGGGNKNTISTIKGKKDRLASGINNRLGLTDKKNVALERFGSIFKSPEGASRVTAGVKNTRNALLNNGVVRAIKDRNINPNNVPYIMNEGKLKKLFTAYVLVFLGDMLLSDEQISNNMTVRSGRRIDPPKRGEKAKVYSDELKRESTALTLNVDPNTAKGIYA